MYNDHVGTEVTTGFGLANFREGVVFPSSLLRQQRR